MRYRTMGRTGEQVSALGFGAMRLPHAQDDFNAIDEPEAIRMIRYAVDNGVNYIDTAWPYHGFGHAGGGASEPLVGKALRDGYRDKVHIATKLPTWMVKTSADLDSYLDAQLERLETDRIDFYLLHALDHERWPKLKELGIFDFMERAKASGKVRYMGFSFHDELEVFKGIVDDYDWDFCQIQYNYIDQTFQAGTAGYEYAAERGLGIVVMEPLRGGNLASLPKAAAALLAAAEPSWKPVELALQWVWSHPGVSLLLSGMSTAEQVEENVLIAGRAEEEPFDARRQELTESVITALSESRQIGCTNCGYCMPCPSGVNIPRNFAFYNDLKVYGNPNSRNSYRFVLSKNGNASLCIECGQCEELCPQHLPIIRLLKDVLTTFEG